MAEKIFMPQLGESVVEGTIDKWLVKVGDKVNKYDPICEVTTDKVNSEVPSTFSGTISEIVAHEGETVAVGALICCIAVEGNELSPVISQADTPPQAREAAVITAAQEGLKTRYSPAVLKLAQEHNLDLSRIKGTGFGGRIKRKDLLEILGGQREAAAAAVQEIEAPAIPSSRPVEEIKEILKPSVPVASSSAAEIPLTQGDEIIPVTAIRKTIANRMVQSKHEAPHAWTMMECDVTNLVRYRNSLKNEFKQKEGINLTYMPFFIKAVVEALKEFPMLNSQWAGDKIIVKKAINISIAVATDDALFVPVIKDADQKSILGLAKSIDILVKKCREGKLNMDDMSDGTFTVNNTGSFGSVLSTPIINQPQAAILSVEAIVKRPVVIDNMIAIRDMMNVCLSLDHRVLDGLVCGCFLQSVKKKIESYNSETKLY